MSIASGLMQAFARSQSLRELGWFGYAIGTVGFALALGVRMWLGDSLIGYPYVTFFPVVVLTTFFGGIRPGIFSAVLCGLGAWYFFMPPGLGFALVWPSTYLAIGFYLLVVFVDIALIHAMDQALAALTAEQQRTAELLRQQQTLFRELQHRVANNMSFVASLLKLQMRKLAPDDPVASVLEDARSRIFAMERIHRKLYDPGQVELPVGPYLEELCQEIVDSSGNRSVTCRVDSGPMVFEFERLVTLSLLISEVVTNALKHAFTPDAPGSISVSLDTSDDGHLELRVLDDGRGLPPDFRADESPGLGMRIVQGLVTQLGGTIDWRPANGQGGRGTLAVVRFPA